MNGACPYMSVSGQRVNQATNPPSHQPTCLLVILKFLQSLIKTLHSEGTPTQIAAGIAIGAALGLTPLVNLHNVVILVALVMLNVSFGAGMLGMAIFAPVGFLLDPLFDRLGHLLLSDATPLPPLAPLLHHSPL